MTTTPAHVVLERLYRAAIDATQPSSSVRLALDTTAPDRGSRWHIVAIGKAAHTMSRAALEWCERQRVPVALGICVSHTEDTAPVPQLSVWRGDHPVPGDASQAAAASLDALIARDVRRGDQVLVLLSGGTSALIGAPVPTLDASTYRAACALLLRAGLDIHAHNAIRRRLSRWGNGRLGAALHAVGATVMVLAMSDVPGDVLTSIGSAPCLPPDDDPGLLESVLTGATLAESDRRLLRDALQAAAKSPVPECPSIPHHVISSNRHALHAVVAAAAAEGLVAQCSDTPLMGDADAAGVRIARAVLDARAHGAGASLWCWGGEPVVAVPASAPPGGRMQALALAAARVLHDAGDAARGITLLAAGTDGRDGNTGAAGAIIDAETWGRIRAAERDPDADRTAFHSHAALRAAHALLPAFASGTNVNDIVIAHVAR